MKELISSLSMLSTWQAYGLSVFLLILVAYIDFWVGAHVSTALFYTVPTIIASCNISRLKITLVILVTVLTWSMIDYFQSREVSHEIVFVWNFFSRFMLLMLIAFIIYELNTGARHYESLSKIDELTGLLNRRGFYSRLEVEINRSQRYQRSFSLAYIDIDNFKIVNDRYGHKIGDQTLEIVASTLRHYTRVTDSIARLGGDEFVVLLVETNSEQAKTSLVSCFNTINQKLLVVDSALSASVGVVTFEGTHLCLTEVIEQADLYMYKIKKSGKNRIEYHLAS